VAHALCVPRRRSADARAFAKTGVGKVPTRHVDNERYVNSQLNLAQFFRSGRKDSQPPAVTSTVSSIRMPPSPPYNSRLDRDRHPRLKPRLVFAADAWRLVNLKAQAMPGRMHELTFQTKPLQRAPCGPID